MDKDYRVEIRVRNNLLYNRIYSKYESIASFCEQCKVSAITVSGLLNFKENIFDKNGFVKEKVKAIADALKCNLEDIIPANYITRESNRYVKEVSEEELIAIEDINEPALLSYEPESEYEKAELEAAIKEVLDSLPKRDREVLILRFFEGKTLQQVADMWGRSRQLVRIIEERALSRCRHPSKRNKLEDFLKK